VRLLRAILLRLFYGVVSLLFISLVTFIASAMVPGDAAQLKAGEKASPETVARIRHQMGLDRPWPVRYVEYIEKASHGDFGDSYTGIKEPVKVILARRIPLTLEVAFAAILLATAVGLMLGTLAAVFQNRFPDRSVLTLSTLGVTVPNFVLAPILVYFFAGGVFDYLPQGWTIPELQHGPAYYYFVLPVVILAARPMALITRLTRASMIDTLQQEFIRTAVAKGVPPFQLLFKHALRNAMLPILTAIGTSFGFLLTGSFVVETYFSMPGLGSLVIEAIQEYNVPVIQAGILVTGFMFIVVNLAVDLVLPMLDPRIRESQV
jgi:peptide/nickel transport system permease protein